MNFCFVWQETFPDNFKLKVIYYHLFVLDVELSGQGLYGGDIVGKGARLFSDYQNLMKIWTHPWVLRLAEIRDENKVSIVVQNNLAVIYLQKGKWWSRFHSASRLFLKEKEKDDNAEHCTRKYIEVNSYADVFHFACFIFLFVESKKGCSSYF